MPADPPPAITLLGPTADDPTIYLVNPQNTQRQPLFTAQLNPSGKPQVRLARLLPPPGPNQQLTQEVGTITSSTLSDKAKMVVHNREFSVMHPGNIGSILVEGKFEPPLVLSALGPGAKLIWKTSSSGRGIELFEKKTKIKIARFISHSLTEKEPELMVYLPVQDAEDECFVDMLVLYVLGFLVVNQKNAKIGIEVLQAVLGGAGA